MANVVFSVMCGTTMIVSIAMPSLEQMCCKLATLSYTSLFGMVAMFIPVAVTAVLDNTDWVALYFWVNLAVAAIITIFATILQSALINDAGKMPSEYTEATMSGQAIAGIISSIANVIAISVTSDQETSALFFFITAAVICLLVTVAYYRLLRNNVFISSKCDSFDEYANRRQSAVYADYRQIDIVRPRTVGTIEVCKLIGIELVTGFVLPLITLSVFPGLVAQIRSTSTNEQLIKYFPSIITFLLFNVFDYFGRFLTNFVAIWVSYSE